MPKTAPHQEFAKPFDERFYEAHHRSPRLFARLGRLARSGYKVDSQEDRQKDQLKSYIVEALDKDIASEYEFDVIDGKLVAGDGELFEGIFARSTAAAYSMVAQDSFYADFLPQRVNAEYEELIEQQLIVKGDRPYNTLFAFSAYSEEFDDGTVSANDKLIKAHQKPYLKRTMVRMFHFDAQTGKAHLLSRSIDGSSVALMDAVAWAALQYQFKAADSTSMLAERIGREFSSLEEARAALDQVVDIAEKTKVVVGSEKFDTQRFVDSQTVVVARLLEDITRLARDAPNFAEYERAADDLLYNVISLLRASPKGVAINANELGGALAEAGMQARSTGESYNACGDVLESTNIQLHKLGYNTPNAQASTPHCPFCNSKALGDCRNMKCTDEKGKCGSELKDGKVIRRFGKKTKEVDWVGAFKAYWRQL